MDEYLISVYIQCPFAMSQHRYFQLKCMSALVKSEDIDEESVPGLRSSHAVSFIVFNR